MAWNELDVDAGPSAREDHTWTIDPAGRVAYLHGGRGAGSASSELWSYDLDADSWTLLQPAGPAPAARFGHVAAWDASAGLVVWSGQQDDDTFFSDTWLYSPVANAWQQLPDGGEQPLARYGSCGGIGPDGGLWISHGFTADEGRFLDTRRYDLAQGLWSDRTPAAPLPVERCLHDCLWTADGKLILYAGQTTGLPALGDLWSFDPVGGTWAEQARPPAPARQLYGLAELAGQAYVFGGGGVDRALLDDLWRFDVASFEWTELDPVGTVVAARSGATLVADAARNRLLLFGGKGESGELADLYELVTAGG